MDVIRERIGNLLNALDRIYRYNDNETFKLEMLESLISFDGKKFDAILNAMRPYISADQIEKILQIFRECLIVCRLEDGVRYQLGLATELYIDIFGLSVEWLDREGAIYYRGLDDIEFYSEDQVYRCDGNPGDGPEYLVDENNSS